MKKITFLLLYPIVAMFTLRNTVNAQKRPITFNSPARSYSFVSPFEEMGFAETKANNFKIKAVRDFVKTYKTISNNKWYLAEDGSSISTFTSDNIKTQVIYDKKGYRLHLIRTYDENKLAHKIRHMVKREYYDATITLVREFETDEGLVIYVHMQDKDTWKIVRIADGEMKLVENLRKS